MKKIKQIILIGLGIISSSTWVDATMQCTESDCSWYYIYAQAGPSFGRCASIVLDQNIWDSALEGYNAPLGTAAMVGLEVGVNYELLSVGVRANQRSKFKYRKKQTPLITTNAGFLGGKTRFFDIDNSSFMFNVTLNRLASYGIVRDNIRLAPYAGVGIGLAHTTVYNFHSEQDALVSVGNLTAFKVGSIMSPHTVNTFAWDAHVGVTLIFCHDVSLGIGYRYFDAGNFQSNNYIIDVLPDFSTPITISPWCGRLRANELVIQTGIAW